MEVNVWNGIVMSYFLGRCLASIRYEKCATIRIHLRYWLGCSLVFVPLLQLAIYFICPQCQEPNRAQMQILSIEQRFKNYIDQKYGIYDKSNDLMWYQQKEFDKAKHGRVMKRYEKIHIQEALSGHDNMLKEMQKKQ